MTPTEFRDIVNDRLLTELPDLRKYVVSLDEITKQRWAQRFAAFHRSDLIQACEEIVSGRVELARYEYEQLSIRLQQICRRFAAERVRQVEMRRLQEMATKPATELDNDDEYFGCGRAFRQVMRAMECPKEMTTAEVEQARQQAMQVVYRLMDEESRR